MRRLPACLALAALTLFTAGARAYPDRPVRLVVGFAAGGGADLGARLFAAALGERWHQQIVIENRGGVGGLLAADVVAHAPPDGYTLLACSINQALAPLLYAKLTVDPVKDFASITPTATLANVLVVNPKAPWRTVGDLIADAKAHPGQLTYGSSGVGASLHLTMELFKSMAGIDVIHVPYKGGGPALADVIAGHIDMMFGNATEQVGAVKSGQVRALGVSALHRLPALPDVPTIDEAGVPGFEVVSWYGLCAPRETPEPILAQISTDAVAAIKSPDYQRRCAEQGIEPAPMTRPEYAAFIDAQAQKWAKVVHTIGLKPGDVQ